MFLSCVGLKLRMCGIYQYVLRPVAIEGNIDAKWLAAAYLGFLCLEPSRCYIGTP